jgi:hypothetical protein
MFTFGVFTTSLRSARGSGSGSNLVTTLSSSSTKHLRQEYITLKMLDNCMFLLISLYFKKLIQCCPVNYVNGYGPNFYERSSSLLWILAMQLVCVKII